MRSLDTDEIAIIANVLPELDFPSETGGIDFILEQKNFEKLRVPLSTAKKKKTWQHLKEEFSTEHNRAKGAFTAAKSRHDYFEAKSKLMILTDLIPVIGLEMSLKLECERALEKLESYSDQDRFVQVRRLFSELSDENAIMEFVTKIDDRLMLPN